MKAMVLDTTGPVSDSPLRWRDVADPIPGPNDVRLKVHCCAVCRTDLHVIEGDLPSHKRPLICGHQVVGTVDQVGEGASRWRVGQRLGIAWLRHTCGVCEYCRLGKENLCEQSRYTGYDEDGGYAEYAVVHEDFAYSIPEVFSDVEAAPLLCAGVIGYRSLQRANVPQGGRLALYGFGSSAHLVSQIAMSRGCEVYVVTRGESHRQLAREMGATWVGEDAAGLPRLPQSAILFAPAGNLVPVALEHLDQGGTLAIAGIHLSAIPQLDYERDLFYERDLRSVTANTRADGRGLLQEAAQIALRPHVATYEFPDANRALQDLKEDRIAGTAVLVF